MATNAARNFFKDLGRMNFIVQLAADGILKLAIDRC